MHIESETNFESNPCDAWYNRPVVVPKSSEHFFEYNNLLLVLGLSDIPFYFAFSLSITAGLLAALIFYFVVAPRLVRWLQGTLRIFFVHFLISGLDGSEISTPSNRNDIMRLSVVSPCKIFNS